MKEWNAPPSHRYHAPMAARDVRAHIQLLLHVARQYYLEDLSQQQIAHEIGYSRATVSRLLSEAKSRKIVEIYISHPLERALELESKLRRKFGLVDARVAVPAEPNATLGEIGRIAGEFVIEHSTPDVIIALSNGTSAYATVESVPHRQWRQSIVVQMVGSIGGGSPTLIDSPDLCRELARRIGGIAHTLPAPLVVASPETARLLRKEAVIVTTLALARRAHIAVLGVGTVGPQGESGQILRPFSDAGVRAEVLAAGAVGHICGHHFNSAGKHVATSLCGRTISLDIEHLPEIPITLAVAWGNNKVPALSAILRTGKLNAFCTDEQTAYRLLQMK